MPESTSKSSKIWIIAAVGSAAGFTLYQASVS